MAEEGLREISVAEFFEKNKHLLGFDNPARALLTSVKEAVDNALDATEGAKVLPHITIKVKEVSRERYRISVEDNGPGIEKKHLGPVFGKLLYGSKFQTFGGRQSRGQQGIGISAAVLWGQLSTNKPAVVISRVKGKQAHKFLVRINIKKNEPEVVSEEIIEWDKDHGTIIEIEMVGRYLEKKASVPEYIRDTAVVNPHSRITYVDPKDQKLEFPRVVESLPKESKRIKPHPYGIHLGLLDRMIKATSCRTVKSFLTTEFDKVGSGTADEIISKAAEYEYAASIGKEELGPEIPLDAKEKIQSTFEHFRKVMPKLLKSVQIEALLKGMQTAKIMAPSTDCLSPIGSEILRKSVESEFDVEFSYALTRPPTVYAGNPFQIEVAVAYGGELEKEGAVKIKRFANRVPLLYQQGACAITKAITDVSWKSYGLQQSGKNIPVGPAIVLVHLASVWAPFTSESKDAVAHYPGIIKEIKLALQECGRHLSRYVSKKQKAKLEAQKKEKFKGYAGKVAESVAKLTGKDEKKLLKELLEMAESMYTIEGVSEEALKEKPEEEKKEGEK